MSRPVVSWIEHHARRIPGPIAFVVLARDARTSPDELLDWCRARLARYKLPARVVLVDERPRNGTGNVLTGPPRASVEGAGQDRSHA